MGKSNVCRNCFQAIKKDAGSITGWRHCSSGQVVCEPKGNAEPLQVLGVAEIGGDE